MDNTTLLMIFTAATPILAGIGSWIAVKVAIATLQIRVQTVTETIEKHDAQLRPLAEDALIHDMELETALTALHLPRVRRQRARD